MIIYYKYNNHFYITLFNSKIPITINFTSKLSGGGDYCVKY